MDGVLPRHRARRAAAFLLAFLLLTAPALPAAAQDGTAAGVAATPAAPPAAAPIFRMERLPVEGGAELLTVFGSLDGLSAAGGDSDVPLVSILRDELGDDDPENDRLRYVWMLTYTRPGAWQRAAAAVPFFYGRVGNKRRAAADRVPPPVIDLAAPERDVWERFMWMAVKSLFINPYGLAVKASANAYARNRDSYRQAHVLRALAILSLYEAETGGRPAFTAPEMSEIQGRLVLTDRMFGGLVDDAYLQRAYQNQATAWLDHRGHNWELLRQRAEAEGLYFEPLELPDGGATHALVWVAREDLKDCRGRKFNSRFLNIADPCGDKRLERWKGHAEVRHFDEAHRPVAAAAAGARAVELIPLALYGLDNPKIPSILVDFRDGLNPKKREMSHRVIEDVARNVLAVSKFGDLHYFLGRTVLDFVTGRRGMDVNQPSRLRTYSQLKLLLALDASLEPALRGEIERRVERVSLNPLENDLRAEARLAREQYAALVRYAREPRGLAAKLDRDRRAEMVPLRHGRAGRVLLRFGNILSLGLYTHRESASAGEQRDALDTARRLAYHQRFLRQVAKSGPVVEVAWDIGEVRRSLRFVAENGARAGAPTAAAAALIFARTEDEETRRLCLTSLYRIDNETAKNELLRIYRLPQLDTKTRTLTAEYLRSALREEQRIAPSDARAIVSVIGQ